MVLRAGLEQWMVRNQYLGGINPKALCGIGHVPRTSVGIAQRQSSHKIVATVLEAFRKR
jgi:hypothetical protein